ncbi:MAG: TerB family tellurite resistance protein [Leptolyngbya sp. RL_3_1]|nr:TerB family tellurite resistance protein [Leptolyngbya sp. RL_3_1]
MPLHPPPPPSISPRQMTLMRIVAAMAWSDGNLAEEEVALMLDRFSGLFAIDPQQKADLQKELRDYMMQNIPLEELIPHLASATERELVLRLGYEVISASALTPDQALINDAEAAAYQKLVTLLDLPPEVVQRVEMESATASQTGSVVDNMADHLQQFFAN